MRGGHAVLLLCSAWAIGCGPGPRETADGPPGGTPDAPSNAPDAAVDAIPGTTDHVYVCSYFKLYKVDPITLELTLIGPFQWPAGLEEELMTDIAVDKEKELTGISFGAVYSINKDTAETTFLANLETSFNGLSFLTQPDDTEILVGTALDGTVWQIDKTDGSSTMVGDFGGVMESSGDLVSVYGLGTIATVKNGSTNDYLARIDPTTGAATIIGNTGLPDIWGVGFWGNRVFGFVATNEFVLIDVNTGQTTFVLDGPENWTGAGVTTEALVIE